MEEHARTRVPHHRADALAHLGPVAVHRAIRAERLLLHERAALAAGVGIRLELGAFGTEVPPLPGVPLPKGRPPSAPAASRCPAPAAAPNDARNDCPCSTRRSSGLRFPARARACASTHRPSHAVRSSPSSATPRNYPQDRARRPMPPRRWRPRGQRVPPPREPRRTSPSWFCCPR